MCRATKCHVCQKTTWTGCGQHVAAVKSSVPAGQWCGGKHSRRDIELANERAAENKGFFAKLFGR
jgi:hypothetical protein